MDIMDILENFSNAAKEKIKDDILKLLKEYWGFKIV
jgi:hypothetical protein